MISIDQEFWNLLFGFLGRECMLPEGCKVPLDGILVYLGVFLLLVAVLKWRKFLSEGFRETLQKAREKL